MRELVQVQQQVAATRTAGLQCLLASFLAEHDVKASSKATYERSLRQFAYWLQETGRAERMATLTREDILSYRESLASAGKSAYTVSTYLAAVRQLYQWLESKKIYPDITRGIKAGRKPRGFRKDILSESQLRQALSTIDRSTLEGLRDYALLSLLARTGLRTVEAARAEAGDLRQEPGLQAGESVLWIQGKGRDEKDEFVLVTREAMEPLRAYLQARGATSSGPLFCSHSDRNSGHALTTRSLSRIAKQALRRIGLDDSRLTAHSMRHTAISLAVLGGASLQQVQAMARHSDPKTTLVYFHNLDRVRAGAERYITI